MLELLACAAILALARRIKVGRLVVLEEGRAISLGPGGPPDAIIEVYSRNVWPLLVRGRRGAVKAYQAALWDSPDLAAVFRVALSNARRLDLLRRPIAIIRGSWMRRNTPERSRLDVSRHYDVGNDLFAVMLGPTMIYSCAVFEGAESTLDEAQLRKLELVCQKLDLGSSDRVVEIGSGWGGFAVYAAASRGCRVVTTTISSEQYKFALKKVQEAGVANLVDVRLEDYRQLRGVYNKLVSLEMIEAVGPKDFPTFFKCCSRLLASDGRMLLQAITIQDQSYDVSRVSCGFVSTHVFPNGCLPSARVIADNVARYTDLRTVHLEDFTRHYVETLRRWQCNLEAARSELGALGYHREFRRLWRLYLAYAEAGFEEQYIQEQSLIRVRRLAAKDLGITEFHS